MTAALPVAPESVAQTHDRACNEVNRWRGHCIECFARLERSAGAALEAIPAVSASRAAKVPHMFGDRMKALSVALAPGGSCPRARIARTLEDAAPVLAKRNLIVHASGRILIDRNGAWEWHYRFATAGKLEETGFITSKDALALERLLQRTAQSLCSQLDALTVKIEANP